MKNFKAHILIVDDDDRIRDLVKEYLNQNNYLVSTAKDSNDAFEKTKIIKFDLIVLDIMMPGKTGLEFTQDYKKKIDTPILLLTAKGEPSERIEGLEVGADDYLTKPFGLNELIARSRALIRRSKRNKKSIEIIKQFNLSPHPEGGWFREIVRSKNYLIREDGQSRNFITGIYYLLEKDSKSAWHRVKNADEIWIYLRGDPLNLWSLDNDNKLLRNLILDSNNPVEMIPSGYWQAAKSTGEFTLVSCCVGPGFDFKDFELLRNTNHTSRLDKAINDLI